jgi:hypothetical protein
MFIFLESRKPPGQNSTQISSSWIPNVVDAILHLIVLGSTEQLAARSLLFPIWMLEVYAL